VRRLSVFGDASSLNNQAMVTEQSSTKANLVLATVIDEIADS